MWGFILTTVCHFNRLYRAQILNALGKDLKAELAWLDQLSTQYLKSYQIW